MEFICPKPLIQMPCLGGASSSSWAHPDLQLEFETPKVRLEATDVVSFRKVEPGAHRHRARDMSWLCHCTNQGTERGSAGAAQGAKALGGHRDLSQASPPWVRANAGPEQPRVVFQQPG